MRNWANTRLAGVLLTATLGALVLSACGGEAAGKSNADLLKEAAANMKAAKSYQMTANVDQAGQAVALTGMIDIGNNNTKMDMDVSGQKVSVIAVGSDVYLSTDGGTTYSKSGAEGASITEGFGSFTKMWDSFQADQVDKAKDALKDGTPATETIDGVATKHITANAKDLSILGGASGTATEGTLDLWISTDKPLVRQMKIDGTSGGQPIKGTLTWSKFDEKFDITAPPTAASPNLLITAGK
ncbi:MAG: hypothetical protein ABI670_19235 [Chloroflexota bacterium]